MLIALTIFLILMGAVLMVASGVMLAVRKAVKNFLNGFPRQLQALIAESDPKVKRALKLLEILPRISLGTAIGGVVLFLLGVGLIHSRIAQAVIMAFAIIAGLIAVKLGPRLAPLLQKQLTDQMKKQAQEQMAKTTPAQYRETVRKTFRQTAPPPKDPTNREQRRQAQRRKQ